ncbi:UPF0182 family protein [Ilumatobacter sp.]|uniref:UPF0182 family protein n=1 Tax=Ilumatobacter sp. TaxID=1967498 RepID=UPI00375163CD|nr:UPF0182 family protein [Ilumatobacter sp.]
MRRSQDLPVDRPRRRISGRGVLIALGGLFMFVLIFGRAIARFYVDYLWHDALDRGDVFWGVIGAKFTLFALFFLAFLLLAFANLFIADRAAPTSFPANVHPYVERFHEVFGQRLRLVRYASAFVMAIVVALPAVAQWQSWLLFRNSKSFGVADPQFGADVGFYVFQLPFLTFLLDWMFVAVILVLLFTAAAHILNGGVVFVSPVPAVRHATKAHIAVLLAVLAVLKAGDYWLDRYELTNSTRGIVDGATYSVVNAQIPAIMLLILIALLTAGLYLSVIKTDSWRLPLLASALWLIVSIVGGVISPAVVQSLIVNPNQESREQVYIERNVEATREALGLTGVDIRDVQFGTLTAGEVEADLEPLGNVRLLNPTEMETRFLVDRGEVAGLSIDDLDVDRYTLDGETEQVLVAARELDLAGISNIGWQGRHLINTRGCGLVAAPTSKVQANQRPDYRTIELDRPELYFSPELSGYGIANTGSTERECDEPHTYEGDQGVRMNSFARRGAFALAFLDYNIIGSGAIEDDSQMLWVRGVNDRLNKLAPFLSYDADPYPVGVDGNAVWVVDGYTTTSRYPYGQSIGDVQRSSQSGLSNSDNYVRNSVKAVVDAYTGQVTFYVVDDEDPILRAWRSAFPDLFTPFSEMPDELADHLRYPEDLFRIQTDVYSKYRIDPALFFQRDGNAWSVAQAPGSSPTSNTGNSVNSTSDASAPSAATSTFATESDAARFVPYYTMFDTSLPGEPRSEEFVILRPFVPFSTGDTRTQLQAYMTASSDPDNYGMLTSYEVQERNGQLPDGPLRVAGNAESQSEISERISLDNQDAGGSKVRFGDLQLVPVGDGLIYVRPYYVAVPQETGTVNSVTEFRFVIVSYNDNSVLTETISEGLARLFPGFEGDVGDSIGSPTEPTPDDPETPADDDAPVVSTDAAELLQIADDLFRQADEALADGNLGEYQTKVDEGRRRLDEAIVILEADLQN